MIRAVTFDFDGTLVDHESAIARALGEVVQAAVKRDPAFPGDSFRRAFAAAAGPLKHEADTAGLPAWQVVEQISRALEEAGAGGGELAPELALVFETCLAQTAIPFPETAGALREVRRAGLGVGLLTNGDERVQRGRVARSGLAGSFDAIVVSGELGFSKPDPRCFEAVAGRLGVYVVELVHVGDDPLHDVAGARSAGARAILVDRRGDGVADPANLLAAVRLLRDAPLAP